MSYEGYVQFLCKNGHAFDRDVYEVDAAEEKTACPVCKEPPIWCNNVDQTNGCMKADGTPWDWEGDTDHSECICGRVDLEVVAPEAICKCDRCGVTHQACPPIYKIPEGKGRRIVQEGGKADGIHDEAPSGT